MRGPDWATTIDICVGCGYPTLGADPCRSVEVLTCDQTISAQAWSKQHTPRSGEGTQQLADVTIGPGQL
jgi:hypothetical protein